MNKLLFFLLVHYALMLNATFSTVGIYSTQSCANITVWVHGTHPIKRLITCKFSPLRKHMYAPAGLSLAMNLPENYYFRTIASEFDKHDHELYPAKHFYVFGWNSAKVTSKQRREAGEKLYKEINDLLSDYHKKYRKINLRIIGFSHGGNVILNCMDYLPFTHRDVFTEVILLATPIQESTRLYVNSSYVDKVYSFYSEKDWIQRIDIQKLHKDAPRHSPFWSKRIFSDTDKVVQVKLKVNGKSIGHLRYRDIMNYIPKLMKEIEGKVGNTKQDHMFVNFMV